MPRARASVAAALLLTACSSTPKTSEEPLVFGTTVPRSYTVTVSGAESFVWQGNVPVRIVTTRREEIPTDLRLLSVGILEPVKLDDGRFMRTAFDLLGYTDPGAYAFGPGARATPGIQLPEGIGSNVFVDVISLKEALTKYDDLRGRCDVEVGSEGLTGEIRCARVASGAGAEISLTVVWSAA